MMEAQWLESTDPDEMFTFLRETGLLNINHRKARLFGCACCRRVWHLLQDERSYRALEAGEQMADGLLSQEDCSQVIDAAIEAYEESTLRLSVGDPNTTIRQELFAREPGFKHDQHIGRNFPDKIPAFALGDKPRNPGL